MITVLRRKGKLPAASASCEDQATCSENVTDDRFSNLPDDVAHIILSFLTFKDAARVGAASKRCRQFYLSVPLVDFDAIWRGIKRTHQNKLRMMNSVDRYLFYRGDNRIQRFCISWSFVSSETENEYCDDHSRVITWIHKAVRCNVEELDVRICGLANTFSLPSCVFLSQSLRSLSVNLNTQILETPSLSFSSNILYLELINLKIADERLFKWISCCCKCIKKLQILNIAGVRNISIESSSLEHFRAWISRDLLHLNISGEKLETIDMFLWFEESYPATSSPSLKIFAPNLKNLKWKGTVGNSPNLGEFTSLEKVKLVLAPQVLDFDNVYEVLYSICCAKVLILSEETILGCFKEGSMAAPIFDNLCNLNIHCTRLDDYLVPIVVSLLRGMPNLNTLYIKARSWMLDGKTLQHRPQQQSMGRKRKLLGASASCEAQGNCSESVTSDRFSDLPDEVAHHILFLLTFKDLTRVGAISKRCRQLHLSVPVVDFRSHWHWLGQLENYMRLMTSMERYLLCRGDNRMQRFCMDWNFSLTRRPTQDYFRVITWIHNALRCNVEELDLCISGVPSFSLPPFLPQSLRSLSVRLSMEIFKTPSLSIPSNLRYLKLVLVKIEDERFFKWITCCCKCIKQLELVHIQGIRNITIESSSLEYFHGFIQSDILHVNISGEKLEGIDICLWFHGYPEISSNSLKIFAPNLKNLNWNSSNGRYSPNLGKLMSLEKVQLFLDPRVNELDKVLCSICSAKDLIINERTIKAIFKDGSTAVPILDNICNLTLHFTSLNDDLVPAVASLLKGMPNLNFFVHEDY
ncbi:PREDICTED: F-box/LRR-repeat [Prunus dulcis]|uniref:PREDICTED: F-box/LRR-repeat n=1 Tax=Prunus dulcis TaxID=3755 RepID=A0A5E4FBV8_PRUDU|nr:PREDICTED: F-box/LRR-repeat [Prunus dulcis]